jgi:hypothetical protein
MDRLVPILLGVEVKVAEQNLIGIVPPYEGRVDLAAIYKLRGYGALECCRFHAEKDRQGGRCHGACNSLATSVSVHLQLPPHSQTPPSVFVATRYRTLIFVIVRLPNPVGEASRRCRDLEIVTNLEVSRRLDAALQRCSGSRLNGAPDAAVLGSQVTPRFQ